MDAWIGTLVDWAQAIATATDAAGWIQTAVGTFVGTVAGLLSGVLVSRHFARSSSAELRAVTARLERLHTVTLRAMEETLGARFTRDGTGALMGNAIEREYGAEVAPEADLGRAVGKNHSAEIRPTATVENLVLSRRRDPDEELARVPREPSPSPPAPAEAVFRPLPAEPDPPRRPWWKFR